MEDWQVAIGIVVIAIIIAIILSKRSWAHKKKKPIKHKLSGVDESEPTPPMAIVVLIILGTLLLFGLYKLATWFFLTAAPKIVDWITTPTNNTYSAINVTGPIASMGDSLGGLPPTIIFLVVVLSILVFMFMLGGRWARRNSLLLFMFGLPILLVLGVPVKFIMIAGIFIIPIIVWRSMRVLS